MPAPRDVETDRASTALLLRPDGRIERLAAPPRSRSERGYTSSRPDRSDATSLVAGARSDRRRRRRPSPEPHAGRLVDLVV